MKLTDFGLSRIGFLDRRVRDELTHKPISNDTTSTLPTSPAPSRSNTPPSSPLSNTTTSTNNNNNGFTIPSPSKLYKHSYFSLLFERDKQRRGSVTSMSTSIGSSNTNNNDENNNSFNIGPSTSTASTPGWNNNNNEEQQQQQKSWLSSYHHRPSNAGLTPTSTSSLGYSVLPNVFNFERNEHDSSLQNRLDPKRNAIGTPDYIAPESILGTGQDYMVDWVRRGNKKKYK